MFVAGLLRTSNHIPSSKRWLLPPRTLLRGGASSSRRRGYQDAALRWARQNEEEARSVLRAPAGRRLGGGGPLTTLEDYLERREWPGTGREHGISLLSHALSAPLTIARGAQRDETPPAQQWACLGARAEASLPPEFWKECLVAGSPLSPSWNIDFIGPEIQSPSSRPMHLKLGDAELKLNNYFQGYFHDLPSLKEWDGFILFNPGIGHPHLKTGWLPTLKQLRGKLWLTAHSELDAERDSKLLKDQLGLEVAYQLNPFASRIIYQDPFDKTHFVSPNKYVAWVEKE